MGKNINYSYYDKNIIVIDYYKCRACKVRKLVDEFDVNIHNAKYLNKICRSCRCKNKNKIKLTNFYKNNYIIDDYIII